MAVNAILKLSRSIANRPIGGGALFFARKNLSTNAHYEDAPQEPYRQVFISQSTDIFTNLALEDWLYRHHNFNKKHLLLLWRNDPCVVIGRHQNPWTEADVPFLRENAIELARRNSGGGTVYHDMGNINCTFFTQRSSYHRRHNLDIICGAIRRMTDLNVSVNKREDIVLDEDYKISGTAAKLGKDNAYHHCTVLVDVNDCVLHDALNSKATETVETRATQSVRVPVKNLRQVDPSVDPDTLQEMLGWEFLRTNSDGSDGGMKAACEQRGFQLVRPDNDWFPGIDKLRDDLQGHQWVFGKTPKFTVAKSFDLPEEFFSTITSAEPRIGFEIEVNQGTIKDVLVKLPMGLLDPHFDVSGVLNGLGFGRDLPFKMAEAIKNAESEEERRKMEFVCECVEDMINEIV